MRISRRRPSCRRRRRPRPVEPRNFRGCIRGCRFCQAGFCYRPHPQQTCGRLCEQATESLEDSGNSEITLASLSTSDYRQLPELADKLLAYCEPRKINLSLPSLRADNFSRELMMKVQKVRKSGLTFAPEAGTQRLRDADNKNVTEEEILTNLPHGVFRRVEQREALFHAGPADRDGRGRHRHCGAGL